MYRHRHTLLSVFMITAIALTAWVTLSFHWRNAQHVHSPNVPDAYMEAFTVTLMDKQGKQHIKITSPKLVHFAQNDTSILTTPQLTIYRKSPQPWFVTSQFARAIDGTEHIQFWGDVTIHHAGDITSPATIIKTEHLMVHTNSQTAETTDTINFIQPNITVKAIGMTADIGAGNINLLSQARGEYVPG